MAAFLYGVGLQLKLSIRNKEILVTYYIVPLVFYLFMGMIFTSIIPDAYKTLIQSMTVFGVTMGGVLGSPAPLVEIYGSDIKKSYIAGNIPLWTAAAGNFLSAFVHMFIMSLIIFVTAPTLFDAVIPRNLVGYFLFLALLIAASLSIGMVYGVFIKSTSKLGMVTQFVFLPSIMLSGIMFPGSLLPKTLQYIGKIFPATWGYQGMYRYRIEVQTLIPLVIIIIIMTGISIWKLKKITVE